MDTLPDLAAEEPERRERSAADDATPTLAAAVSFRAAERRSASGVRIGPGVLGGLALEADDGSVVPSVDAASRAGRAPLGGGLLAVDGAADGAAPGVAFGSVAARPTSAASENQ